MKSTDIFLFKTIDLAPYITKLKDCFGLPYIELYNEIILTEMDTEHRDEHLMAIDRNVEQSTIYELFDFHFGEGKVDDRVKDTLFIAANLYHYNNGIVEEDPTMNDEFFQQQIDDNIYEELAHLYSFLQTRKLSPFKAGKNGIPNRPIKLVSDNDAIVLEDTNGWLEVLFENHIFPNCLPEVKNDDDARNIWNKKGKPGRHISRWLVNGIVNGVATFLQDEGVVCGSPVNLHKFIVDYLKVLGLLNDFNDSYPINHKWVKAQIHNLHGSGPILANYDYCDELIEKLTTLSPSQKAYSWLFTRKTDKTSES